MKVRKVILFLLLTLLFIGLSYAAEVSNDTENHAYSTDKIVQSDNTNINEANNVMIDEKNVKNEIIKQDNNKTVKTASSRTYTVNDFDTLHAALTSSTYNTVTLNIKSNIVLKNNTALNEAIKKVTINGNGKTISGNKTYQFLEIYSTSRVIIKNLKITNCYAYNDGGAIYNYMYGDLTLSDCILNNNKAYCGGAIENSGNLTLINCTFKNNIAEFCGGAVYNYMGGNLTIRNSILNRNNATSSGGAIFNSYYGNLNINNSIVNSNTAEYCGGAIYNTDGTQNINNCTLNNNKASQYGGGIYNVGTSNIVKSTFKKNYASTTKQDIYNDDFGNPGVIKIIEPTFDNANTKTILNKGIIYLCDSKIKNKIDNQKTITYFSKLTNNEKNFAYLNNLILSGKTTIKLNYDLKLDVFNNEESDFPEGIELKVNNLVINGNGHKIDAQAISRIFKVYGNNIVIKNIKLVKGYGAYGGAIENEGILTVTNVTFNSNSAEYGGGAICNRGTLTVRNCKLNNNNATSIGGAIHNIDNTLKVINSTLKNNTAEYSGGAIYNNYGTININGCTLNNNRADNGGAVNNGYGNNIIIKNNKFFNNTATLGSAILSSGYYLDYEETEYYGKDILISGNTFTKNKANTTGKAITNNGTNTTLKNNTRDDISKDSSSIYLDNAYNTKIISNVFDDGRKTTVLTVESSKTVTTGKQMSIYGKLTDQKGNNLANRKITIKVDGKTYTTKTTQYGNYNIKITPTTTGKKTITSIYGGTNAYLPSSATSTFTANKETTILTVGSTKTVTTGKQMSIYGKLTDQKGNNLANQKITIKVDGKTYTTNTTQYGNYNIKITPTTTGTKTITANYKGTTTYIQSTATSTFTVNKKTSTLTVGSTKTVTVGKQMSVYGKLTDNNNKDIAYQTVTIKVDQKTYSATTSKYGNYNIKITPTTTGTKTITVNYKGTTTYTASTATSTFKVVKS